MAHRSLHSTATVVLLAACSLAALAAPVQAQGPPAELVVQIGSNIIGSAESSVQRTDNGWIISGSGRLRPPIDLVTRRVEVRYDAAWRPQELQIDGITQGGVLTIRTTFSSTEAHNDITRLSDRSTKVDKVSADTLVLPNLFFSTYEALALRLGALEGEAATLPIYVAPQAEILMHVKRLPSETIEAGDVAIQARRFSLQFMNPGNPLDAELWIDQNGRLLRFVAPAQQLAVTRADVARVNVRLQPISRPGDQTIRVPANGFTIVGTLSEPSGTPPPKGRWPVIVMVPGSGAVDRDETVAGIPIFGQLAGSFADAGFLVVRYDKRGVGQSGGRSESATLEDYAADVGAVVKEIARRKDVDSRRIAVFGHSEGAWIGLIAAARHDRIAALVLAGAPSGKGADLVLEQQTYLLSRMPLNDSEKKARMDLQQRIQAAVTGEGEWEGVPSDLRRQADTPWFRSFLAFTPASIMRKVDQPILLVHGELDRTVAVHHVDRLLELAQARRKDSKDVADAVKLPGLNHLLVEAETGDMEEYPQLTGKRVSPEVARTVIAWLGKTMPQRQ